jgi:hypothetical protein
MRNLLRSLVLALILVPALAGVPSARALTTPSPLEACVDASGLCSGSGSPCATRFECGAGQTCICQ